MKKADQLVSAAAHLIHERGVAATTLALVAARAKVPLGNIFYYFKTKSALLDAVVARRTAELRAEMDAATQSTSPLERLCAVLAAFEAGADTIIRLGCPRGSLASEMKKIAAGKTARGNDLLLLQLDWMETQFVALSAQRPRARAADFLCALQGACLVAHALHDSQFFRDRLAAMTEALRREFAASRIPKPKTRKSS